MESYRPVYFLLSSAFFFLRNTLLIQASGGFSTKAIIAIRKISPNPIQMASSSIGYASKRSNPRSVTRY
jgi:hypothetical protein